jgi:protein gp37
MGQITGISWTDHTFNPWWGCQRVSPGCEHCYAETLAVTRRKLPVWGPPSTTERKRIASGLKDLPKWNAAAKRDGVRRRVFCASMADVFEAHPQVAPWRAEALDLLAQCDGLDVQLLTKRPENIRGMVPTAWLTSWPAHVWIGTTVEDQRRANERIPHLLRVPAAVRFLSMEPLLEAVDLVDALSVTDASGESSGPRCNADGSPALSWVIVGGESGTGARPFGLAWARSIVGQCDEAGVPVFVKQMGDHAVATERECPAGGGCGLDECAGGCHYGREETHREHFRAHHGADPAEWPADLRRQSFPAEAGR